MMSSPSFLGRGELDVLDIDDAIQLADLVGELRDLVEAAGHLAASSAPWRRRLS